MKDMTVKTQKNLNQFYRPEVWYRLVHVKQLLVLSVTPFEIDQNKNQNRWIDKVQKLGNERRYVYKDPRQDSGQRNISYTRYPNKCFTQTYRDPGGDSAYERGRDARRKFWIKPLEETDLGVAQAFFDP